VLIEPLLQGVVRLIAAPVSAAALASTTFDAIVLALVALTLAPVVAPE